MMSINAKARPINDTNYSYHTNAKYYNTVIIINKQLQMLLHAGSTVKPSHVNITLIFLHKTTATSFVILLCM